MHVLVDSNVLARYLNPDDPTFRSIRATLHRIASEETLCWIPQLAVELANFLTRPLENNGFGYDVTSAAELLDRLENTFEMMYPDPIEEYRQFRILQKSLGVSGKQVHDIRIVSSCVTLGIETVITFNARHFTAAEQAGLLRIVTPSE